MSLIELGDAWNIMDLRSADRKMGPTVSRTGATMSYLSFHNSCFICDVLMAAKACHYKIYRYFLRYNLQISPRSAIIALPISNSSRNWEWRKGCNCRWKSRAFAGATTISRSYVHNPEMTSKWQRWSAERSSTDSALYTSSNQLDGNHGTLIHRR